MLDETRSVEDLLVTRFGLAPQAAWPAAISRAVSHLASTLQLTPHDVLLLAQRDERRLAELAAACTVNESHFFRHPEHFSEIVRAVAGWQQQGSDRVVIWSAGCAHGQEPYSVAIALAEQGLDSDRVEIRATDVSPDAVSAARQGRFHPWSCRGLTERLLARYFTAEGPSGYQIAEHLRARVTFRQGALADEARTLAPDSVHVVLFRNVAIYLTPSALSSLFDELALLLRRDGQLLVAPTDPVPPPDLFQLSGTGGHGYRPTPPRPAMTARPATGPELMALACDTAPEPTIDALRLAVCLDASDVLARYQYAVALAHTAERRRALAQLHALIHDLTHDQQHRRLGDGSTTVAELLRTARAFQEQLQ